MRFANQSLVFVVGNHHDTFFALPGDALWPLGPRQPEYFTEASFRSLNLPGLPCCLDIEILGLGTRGAWRLLSILCQFPVSLQTGLTIHSLGHFAHSRNQPESSKAVRRDVEH